MTQVRPDQDGETKDWFWTLLERILQSYARTVNLEFLQRKYPGLPREAIAARRINAAARHAGLIGFVSGAAISIASAASVVSVLSTAASGLLASSVTVPVLAVAVPVAVVAFAFEINGIFRIQLHLAYDLFVVYGLPTDLDDPEQANEIIKVAFGIKGAEVTGQAIQKLVPQIGPILLRKAMRVGLVRRKAQEWTARMLTRQIARKYLAEGILIRALVPGIAIVTATGWDYLATKAIGNTLQASIRPRGLAAVQADELALEHVGSPALLLRSVLALVLTSGDLCEAEVSFYARLVERLRNTYGDEAIDSLGEVSAFDWDWVMADLANVGDKQEQGTIFEALVAGAVVGGALPRGQRKRLRDVARLYGIPFDVKRLKVRLRPFKEPRPGRSCLVIVLVLWFLMMSSCLVCSLAILLPRLQNEQSQEEPANGSSHVIHDSQRDRDCYRAVLRTGFVMPDKAVRSARPRARWHRQVVDGNGDAET